MAVDLIFKNRNYWPLFWTQFFGALNDNFLKNALIVMVTYQNISVLGMSEQTLVAFSAGLFILPFFLFSATAGQIADHMEKSKLIRLVKIWELLLMSIAGFGFYFDKPGLLLFVLFLMGLQSTFFGPVKYSIIPQLLPKARLVEGNAYIEVGTFLAILLGMIIGTNLIRAEGGTIWVISLLITVALAGFLTSLFQKSVGVSDPELKVNWSPIKPTIEIIKVAKCTPAIFNSILGISWFWFLGAAVLTILPVYSKTFLIGDETVFTTFLCIFTIGVAMGSILCEKLSFQRVEVGIVPFGSIGMSLFLIDLFFVRPSWVTGVAPGDFINWTRFLAFPEGRRIAFDLLMFSISAGVYIVPLYALIQERSSEKVRSRMIASNNVMNALFMVVSSVLIMVLAKFEATSYQMFLTFAVMNVFVAVYIYYVVPEFALRFLSWLLVHVMYRLKVKGDENIPREGPAILACNHVSFVDWLFIMGTCKRPVRFVIDYRIFNIPILKTLFTHAKVIPIASKKENPEMLEKAFQEISRQLRDGEVVGIFPEGKITKNGEIDIFRSGIERAIGVDPVPVVPMALEGLWGSFFSFNEGQAMKKLPRRFWNRVKLNIGEPISPENVKAADLELKVRSLLKEANTM